MSKFTVTRFLRVPTDIAVMYDDEAEREFIFYSISNLGGIVFHFDVDHQAETVKYSFAQCRSDDNFDRKKGTALAVAAMAAGDFITMDSYDQEISLMDNVYSDLHVKGVNKDPIFVEKKLYRLKNSMRKIGTQQAAIVAASEALDKEWA